MPLLPRGLPYFSRTPLHVGQVSRAKISTGISVLVLGFISIQRIRSTPNTTICLHTSHWSSLKSLRQPEFLSCVTCLHHSAQDALKFDGFKDFTRQSIFGHSMGGHGALTLYLASKTKQYRSASAFSPISNPTKCSWGEKAFKGYLQGGVEEAKAQYDGTELIAKSKDPVHILIDYVCIASHCLCWSRRLLTCTLLFVTG